jgi:chaperonin GroES
MAQKQTISIEPLADRVVVKPLEAKDETVSASGIIISTAGTKEKPSKGKVVAVGPGRTEEGKLIPVSVKVGQTILFSKYAYEEVKVENEDYFILPESQILAVIK